MIKLSFQFSIQINGMFWGKRNSSKEGNFKKRPLALVAKSSIEQLAVTREKSTVDNYATALRSFLAYAGEEVEASCINQHLIEGYQQWLMDRDTSMNSISCYMRSLRSVLRQIDPTFANAFKNVFTGNTKTEKRSVRLQDIQKIRDSPLPESSRLQFVRDLFLFSFYALGMPFVDLAFLKKTQISDGYIRYSRHKTGQSVKIKLETPMQHIINKYMREGSPYVFPILTANNKQEAVLEYEKAINRYNQDLKRLARVCGMKCRLTSYVARHTWASQAYQSNVALPIISKALGHTSTETTLTYIREIDDYRIDDANQQILASMVRRSE